MTVPVTSVSLLKVLGEDAQLQWEYERESAFFDIKRNNVDQIKARMVAKLKELALSYAGVCDSEK